jgi:hypothetical protein
VKYRNLSIAIKNAVKDGKLTMILPFGYYGVKGKVIDENPVSDTPNGSRGLVQNFVILDSEDFKVWFLSPENNNSFLQVKGKRKNPPKNPLDLDTEDFAAEFERYQKSLTKGS